MKRILFPTDFSKNADHALKYALELCELLKAELIIFHACHLNAISYQLLPEESNDEDVLNDAKKKLDSYCNRLTQKSDGIKIMPVVEYGLAVDAILDAAKSYKAGMIIMGTKGSNGLGDKIIGSNTINLIEKSHFPVLVIPDKSRFRKINQIAFATDYKETDMHSLHELAELAELFDAEIIVVHIADYLAPVNYENALLSMFELDVRNEVPYKKLSFQILKGAFKSKSFNQFVEEKGIDLIALTPRLKNIFSRLFENSFTAKVAYHSHVPLLTFQKKN